MKKKTLLSVVVTVIVVLAVALTLVACEENDNGAETITITVPSTEINEGDVLGLTVTTSKGSSYQITISDPALISVDADGGIKVIGKTEQDKSVTITASLVDNPSISNSVTILVKANSTPSFTITATSNVTTLTSDGSAVITVNVSDGSGYVLSIKDDDHTVEINGSTVTVKNVPSIDKYVTIVATSTVDSNVTGSVNLLVKADVVLGQVGDLTSDMISALGNYSITIAGTITDYYQDCNDSSNNTATEYKTLVEMEEGKWNGSWYASALDQNVIEYYYRKGKSIVTNANGETGSSFDKVYINKDNLATQKTITDFNSIPAVWDTQHLWNHLGNLNVNKFRVDASDPNTYIYNFDVNSMEDQYLMTYLAICMTPMLGNSDTFYTFGLIVEDGVITKIKAQTEVLYYEGSYVIEDATERVNADTIVYTDAIFEISKVGTTTVSDPAPFGDTLFGDKLTDALEKMSKANNYTFDVTETYTSRPTTDSDDYDYAYASDVSKPVDYISATGREGVKGWVTAEGALFATTGMYSYTSDGKPYHTSHTGYRQYDGYFEEFVFNATAYKVGTQLDKDGNEVPVYRTAMQGKKKVEGSMFAKLPTFNLSPNVFRFAGSNTDEYGNSTYKFVLRDSTISREVAYEIARYDEARNAEESISASLTIIIDGNGNIVSTLIPFSITYGTYTGYYQTVFSNVGTTELPAGTFEDYIPRDIPDNWNEFTIRDYYYLHTNDHTNNYGCCTEVGGVKTWDCSNGTHVASADYVFTQIFGENAVANDLINPAAFVEIFGDNTHGPWYHDRETAAENVWIEYVSLTTQTDIFDENSKVNDELFADLYNKMKEVMAKYGYQVSEGNTDISGGKSGQSDRYITFIKGDVQIVIQNNHTKNFWIYFYKTGDWTLSK